MRKDANSSPWLFIKQLTSIFTQKNHYTFSNKPLIPAGSMIFGLSVLCNIFIPKIYHHEVSK